MLTKQFRQFEQWAEDQEKTKKLRNNKCIIECIEILTKKKDSIDRYNMWGDDLMPQQYQQLDRESETLSEIINYLKSKI